MTEKDIHLFFLDKNIHLRTTTVKNSTSIDAISDHFF